MHWLAEFDGHTVTVEAPASAANLGAGYDCLAVALSLVNRVQVEVRAYARGEVEVTVSGEGEGEIAGDDDNRFLAGLRAALVEVHGELPEGIGWRIAMTNRIPLGRGLGSSAAATVSGLLAGNTLAGGALSSTQLLALATAIEGHPDNAAAVLHGGFVVVGPSGDGLEAIRFGVPRELRAVVFVPEQRLPTADMRRVLPSMVPLGDAVANLGRVGLGVAGLASGRYDLLRELTVDRLHEPYRAAVYPELPLLVSAAREAGAIGACLSGSGSTVLAFSDSMASMTAIEAAFMAVAADRGLAGRVEILSPREKGATVTARTS